MKQIQQQATEYAESIRPIGEYTNIIRRLKLPKWAQNEFKKQESLIKDLQLKLEQAEKANDITSTMDWFTLGFNMKEARALFILHKDAASKIATIGEGDIILIGREKK